MYSRLFERFYGDQPRIFFTSRLSVGVLQGRCLSVCGSNGRTSSAMHCRAVSLIHGLSVSASMRRYRTIIRRSRT
jgi:hypothetical protein